MASSTSKQILKIGMIDVDLLDNGTRHPNLAQMKMSAYCKSENHEVKLLFKEEDLNNLEEYDLLIASKVFNFTKIPSQFENILKPFFNNLSVLNGCIVETLHNFPKNKKKPVILIGGTGFFEVDGGRNLHPQIEHIKPDYDLYTPYVNYKIEHGRKESYFDDYLNYSIGFTSRGCFRKCHFCVNKKYDHAFVNSPVSEFLDERRPRIYLWDDNIFALHDGWENIFDQLIQTHKPFQFRQGLDIRLVTEAHAKKLCNCKYHGDFIFAFDHVDQAKLIERKLQLWRNWCGKTTKLYVLCAFDSWDYEVISTDLKENYHHYYLERMNGLENQNARDEEDIEGVFERIKILMKYGCLPYIMRFQNYKNSNYAGVYTQLARWCNQPNFFKKKSFRQFCIANKEYSKSEKCSAYESMIDFEKARPDIAEKYFDMRFDEENECIISYGRRITHPCKNCKSNGFVTWEQYSKDEISKESFIGQYFSGKLDIICLKAKKTHLCKVNLANVAKKIVEDLMEVTPDQIIKVIHSFDEIRVSADTIPQFSDIDDALESGLNMLSKGPCTFYEFGDALPNCSTNSYDAKQKYGENHAKYLTLLDLAWIDKQSKPNKVNISPVGQIVQNFDVKTRKIIAAKLSLRIPIIQELICSKDITSVINEKMSPLLRESTLQRRESSLMRVLEKLRMLNHPEIDEIIKQLMPQERRKSKKKPV